jgi:hypothetical protein
VSGALLARRSGNDEAHHASSAAIASMALSK